MSKYIAVDVGATKIRIGTFDGEKLTRKVAKGITNEGPIKEIVSYLKNAESYEGIGIASAGPLNLREGYAVLINFNNLKVNYLKDLKPYGKVYLTNDCVAGLLAESQIGNAKGSKNAVYITFSTGIGAGVMVDGHVLIGKDGNAHEVGHIVVNFDEEVVCGCGKYSHWEAYCGGRNIPAFFEKVTGIKVKSAEEAFKLFYDGVKGSEKFMELCMKINSAGVASVINAYDPEVVLLSGSVFLNNEALFLEGLNKYLPRFVTNSMPKIVTARLKEDAVIYGAGILAKLKGELP